MNDINKRTSKKKVVKDNENVCAVCLVHGEKFTENTLFLLIIYFVRFSFNDNGVLVWNYTVYSCKVKVKDRRKQIKLIVDVTWRRRRRRVLWVWVSTFSLSFSASYGAMMAIWCRSNLFLFWQNCLFTFMDLLLSEDKIVNYYLYKFLHVFDISIDLFSL